MRRLIAFLFGRRRPTEAELDALAREAMVRAEHEATHGEAEMCGAECIELGLVDFEEETTSHDPYLEGLIR